jgi:hypothetical protein
VNVTLQTGQYKGNITKYIDIDTNDPRKRRVRLAVTAFVKVFLEARPRYINFGVIERDKDLNQLKKQVEIFNFHTQPVTLKQVNTSPNIFSVSLSSNRILSGESAVLQVWLLPCAAQKTDQIVGIITILTDVKEIPYVKIPVRGRFISKSVEFIK